jgi:tetratricopeptide (TPR) repeat protein
MRCLLLVPLIVACDGDSPSRTQVPRPTPAPAKVHELSPEQTLHLRVADNPADVAAKTQLANLYYDQNRHREAIPMYLEALAVEPENVNLRTDLGTCYIALKRYPEARVAYERAMRDDPAHLNSVFNLGVVENLEGNFVQAAELWEQAKSMSTNPAQVEKFQELADDARQRAQSPPPDK